MLLTRLFSFISCAIIQSSASRVLAIFPTPSISHQVVFRPLILELVNRGHEVILLTTDPIFKKGQGPSNLTEIDVHDISYKAWADGFMLRQGTTTGSENDLVDQMSIITELMVQVFEKQYYTDEMQAILKNKPKIDLFIFEAYFGLLLGLTHVFKDVPVIQFSSLGPTVDNLRNLGAPIHPLIYPTSLQQKLNDLSFWDKIKEVRTYLKIDSVLKGFSDNSNVKLKQLFGDDVPEISVLEKNVDMVFLNVHPAWDSNRPVPPNTIYTGGLHQKPEKELPQDLKAYLDSSKHGVIYISFGTNVEPSLLPAEKIQAMIDVFSKLPYDVLWKWNQDELPGKTDNIKISKWLPQSDLLRHPKVKLFITQGGLQSTDEAITAAVPMLGIPMLADQWFNVELYIRHKIGQRLDMKVLTADSFEKAVKNIIEDKSYKNNILRLRTILNDQPQTALERAIWWTEYVIRNKGAKHLKSPASGMSWFEYLELELVLYLLVGIITVVSILVFVVYRLYQAVKSHSFSVKVKKS